MHKILTMIIMFLFLISCNSGYSDSPSTHNELMIDRSAKLVDNDGDFIAYVLDVGPTYLTVFSTTGYLYSCNWKFEPYTRSIYATGTGGTGTLFEINQYGERDNLYGKTVYGVGASNDIFTYSNIDVNGLAQEKPGLNTYESSISRDDLTFNDTSGTTTDPVYEVKIVSYADIGLPDINTITLPLALQFEDE